MKVVIADLNEREYSIKRLLEHIDEISDVRGKIEVIVILKSSVFIALYNNIEATIYSVLEKIHDSASSQTYDELVFPLKKKMLRYSFGKTAASFINNPMKVKEEEIKFRSKNQTFPTLPEYLRRQSLFSGNIDARKLNVILVSYGMAKLGLKKQDAEKMLWVKNKRNKIAHGEQSMSDGGQAIKTSDLKNASISVSEILRDFIDAAETYLKIQGYRLP